MALPTYTQQQTSFRQGEVGTAFLLKNNYKVYHEALLKAENCNIDHVGNVSNRRGWKFVCASPTDNDFPNCKVVTFSFVNDSFNIENRVIIFTEYLATVYEVDGSFEHFTELCTFATTYKAETMCQAFHTWLPYKDRNDGKNIILFTHRSTKPFVLAYNRTCRSAADFNMKVITLENIPEYTFIKNNKKGNDADVNTGTINITQEGNTYIVTATNNAFTDVLCANYTNKFIQINPIGRLRILKKRDNKTLVCTLVMDLGKMQNIAPEDITLELGGEPIVSESRGWFGCCAVHEGRLFLGNTRDLPNALIGSTTEFCFDFNINVLNDSDGLFTLIDTPTTDEITALKGGSTLHILTKHGIYVLSSGGSKVVPLNFDTTHIASQCGGDTFTDGHQTQEGGIVYIDSEHEQLFYVSYDRSSESFSPIPLNVILPKGTIKQSPDTFSFQIINYGSSDGQVLYFIQAGNLDICKILLSLTEDSKPCFTHYTVANNLSPIKLFVFEQRLYGILCDENSNQHFIAVLDRDVGGDEHWHAWLDLAVQVTLDENGEGNVPDDYLKDVYAKYLDESTGVYNTLNIDENGTINIPVLANHKLQIGFPYEFNFSTLERDGAPPEVMHTLGKKKHIQQLRIAIREATQLECGVTDDVNSEIIFQTVCKGTHIAPVKEIRPIRTLNGWYKAPILVFRQKRPGPITIQGYEVDVGLGRY